MTPSLVPFVRAFYARQSVYLWWDGAGACHRILQGDGCEQGDALAPALFALAQHAALVAASQQLRPGEFLAAFLDDLYIVTVPNRARAALEAVSSAVEELAGVAANLGKTRVYNRAATAAPPGICFSSSARGRPWSLACHTRCACRLLGGLGLEAAALDLLRLPCTRGAGPRNNSIPFAGGGKREEYVYCAGERSGHQHHTEGWLSSRSCRN